MLRVRPAPALVDRVRALVVELGAPDAALALDVSTATIDLMLAGRRVGRASARRAERHLDARSA